MYGCNLQFNVSTYAHSQCNLIDGLLHRGTVNDVAFDGVSRMNGRRLWHGICESSAVDTHCSGCVLCCELMCRNVMPCVPECVVI